jgi:TatD DNase family protein
LSDLLTIDSHCHLDFKQFNRDRAEVIQRARESGIEQMVNSGVDLITNKRTLALAAEHDFIFATLGLSPNFLDGWSEADIERVLKQMVENHGDAVAIGEAGLDFYRCQDKASRERQARVFLRVKELARSLNMPLVIHSRDAEQQALEMVRDLDKVVFHCYSGTLQTMRDAVDRGYYISLATNLCRSPAHQILARNVPLEHLLIETDSPFLSPRRGRNEPAYILDSVRLLSRIRGLPPEEVAKVTAENARKAFGLRRMP